MDYFIILIKTNYSREYLEKHQRKIAPELRRNPELIQVRSKVNNINNIESHLEIAVWPLNKQMINQELKKAILTKIKSILGQQFILSIEVICQP